MGVCTEFRRGCTVAGTNCPVQRDLTDHCPGGQDVTVHLDVEEDVQKTRDVKQFSIFNTIVFIILFYCMHYSECQCLNRICVDPILTCTLQGTVQ